MNVKKYLDIRSNLLRENLILKLGIITFAIASVISAITSYRAMNYSRTVIVPISHATETFSVSSRRIDVAGIKMFVRYAFDLYLNYTPKSAKAKFGELIPLIHIRYYDAVNNELQNNLRIIEQMKIVSTFQITDEIKINETKRKIRVKGIRNRSTYGKTMDETLEEWELEYEMVDAEFKITKLSNTTKG